MQSRGAEALDFCYVYGHSMTPRRLKTVIRQLRESKGWSQLELARRSEVDQGYVSHLEAGTKKNPSIAVLKKLARALGVPVGELLE